MAEHDDDLWGEPTGEDRAWREPETHAHHHHPGPPEEQGWFTVKTVSALVGGLIILVLSVLVIRWMLGSSDETESVAGAGASREAPVKVIYVIPSPIYGTTPDTLKDFNEPFNLEADEPVWVRFPGQNRIPVGPGFNRCMPLRKYSGDVIITAQSNPRARVAYRVYQTRGEDACNR